MPLDELQKLKNLSSELKGLIDLLGIEQDEIKNLIDTGGGSEDAKNKAVDKVVDTVDKIQKLIQKNKLPKAERADRIKELELKMEQLEIIHAFHPDFQKRISAEREASRLNAQLAVIRSSRVFRFEDLITEDGDQVKILLENADKDIKARANLQRVLKGTEIVLSVAVFAAAIAAKAIVV